MTPVGFGILLFTDNYVVGTMLTEQPVCAPYYLLERRLKEQGLRAPLRREPVSCNGRRDFVTFCPNVFRAVHEFSCAACEQAVE